MTFPGLDMTPFIHFEPVGPAGPAGSFVSRMTRFPG